MPMLSRLCKNSYFDSTDEFLHAGEVKKAALW